MNDHQQVANYILAKLKDTPIPFEQAEVAVSARNWLVMIANGQLEIQNAATPEPATDLAAVN